MGWNSFSKSSELWFVVKNRSSLKLVELARHSPLGSIAQTVERRTGIPKVRVQIPLGPTIFPLTSQYRFTMFTCCPEDDSN